MHSGATHWHPQMCIPAVFSWRGFSPQDARNSCGDTGGSSRFGGPRPSFVVAVKNSKGGGEVRRRHGEAGEEGRQNLVAELDAGPAPSAMKEYAMYGV